MDSEKCSEEVIFLPKISIIVPIYRVEKFVERCIDSVIRQTYRGRLECILVDDKSPDQSLVLVRQRIETYCGKIEFKILQHHENRGLSAARNTGIREATGDYLYFLDSDDEITPDAIEILGKLAVKYEGVELVYGNLYVSEPKKFLFILPSVQEYFSNPKNIRKMMLERKKIPVIACNKLIKRTFLFENDLWFREGLIHEDEIWNFFAAKYVKSLAVSSHATYVYYQNENSIMDVVSPHRAYSLIKIAEIFICHIDGVFPRLQRRLALEMGYNALSMMLSFKERDIMKSQLDSMRQIFKRLLIQAITHLKILEFVFVMPFYLPPAFFKIFKRYYFIGLHHLM